MGEVGNSASHIVDKLMNSENIEGMTIKRTGVFRSRSVKFEDQTSRVDKIIKEIGIRIKAADAKSKRQEAEKLKTILHALTAKEKTERDHVAKLHHVFSRRDRIVSELEHKIDKKLDTAPSDIINILSEFKSVDLMEQHIAILRDKKLPRQIWVNGKKSNIKEVIKELEIRIKKADLKDDLEKLKMILDALSKVEKNNRHTAASIRHFFSGRDRKVLKLGKLIEKKISQREMVKLLENGIKVEDKSFPMNLLTFMSSKGKPVMGFPIMGDCLGEIIKCPPIYYITNDDQTVTFSLSELYNLGSNQLEFIFKFNNKDSVFDCVQISPNGPSTQEALELFQLHPKTNIT